MMSVEGQLRARQFYIRFVVVPIALVPTGIVGILIVVLLVVLVVPIAVTTLLARLALLVISVIVVAVALSLAGALALTLRDSRHAGQVSEKPIVSDSFSESPPGGSREGALLNQKKR
jgi:hypothetical protein